MITAQEEAGIGGPRQMLRGRFDSPYRSARPEAARGWLIPGRLQPVTGLPFLRKTLDNARKGGRGQVRHRLVLAGEQRGGYLSDQCGVLAEDAEVLGIVRCPPSEADSEGLGIVKEFRGKGATELE
ncbi:MAG: hypothetical protein Q4D79_11175 [Propionibacteriaceae bacterium]|nr:hypothetical protein [Propionibacteriaceae bacterium]